MKIKKKNLICTNCGKSFDVTHFYPRCDICNEPLEVEKTTCGKIRDGNVLKQTILERYADFFPFEEVDLRLSLKEGFTPLIETQELARKLGIKSLWFKNETQNPTWSFKDRGTFVGIQHAVAAGFSRIGTVSTGNMAVSVAAYGARAGLKTFILISATIPAEKILPIAIYNPILIKVTGDYGELYFNSLELGKHQDIYFINSDVPFRVEGSKTIAFEICEQLNFRVPDYVIVPNSSGGNLRGILKGFEEFYLCGLIDRMPRMVCVQAAGCAPIYNAFIKGEKTISRVEHPQTIAHAIENPYPPSGNEVLRKLRENNGLCIAVTDEEILSAQRELALMGIFAQPEGAVPLAGLRQLKPRNFLAPEHTVVCIVTGSGLKYPAALEKHQLKIYESPLPELTEFIATSF